MLFYIQSKILKNIYEDFKMSRYLKSLWKDKKEYDEWIIDLNEWYEKETAYIYKSFF